MKVFCHGLDLADALIKVSRAIPSKKTVPILEGILISAQGSTITLTATDLEIGIQKVINAEVKVEGEVVVPGKEIVDFVKTLSSEQIELDATDKSELKIRYCDSEFGVKLLNADEFPPLREIGEETSFSIIQKEFKDLIAKVKICASTDDARPILKGCLLEIAEHKLTGVTLDGYRLCVCEKALESNNGEKEVVVPVKTLDEISKVLEDDDYIVTIFLQDNYLMLDIGHTKIVSRLLDGEFTRYRKIIPSEFSSNVVISKSQLSDALDRASLVSRGDKSNMVKFDIKEKTLVMESKSENSNIKESITVSLDGKDIEIAFNARYFIECMKVISDEYVKLSFSTSINPCLLRPAEGEEYIYLILPVKINY